MKKSFIILIFMLISGYSFSQMYFGPKAGIQIFRPVYLDAVQYDSISVMPKIGFNAGISFIYEANDLISFYTDILYSRRGKRLTGGIKDQFRHNAIYHYLEMPILIRLSFEERLKTRFFKWYVNAGGTLNYWIAGNGYVESFEYEESAIDGLNYTIRYTSKVGTEIDKIYTIYLSEPYRIQPGLILGGGLIFPLNAGQHLALDLRYTFRHTWLARDHGIDLGLTEYYEDFRTMEHIFCVSLAYLFEYNLGQGRKGKSSKGQKIKTKTIRRPSGNKR